jgi:hypothetical protein
MNKIAPAAAVLVVGLFLAGLFAMPVTADSSTSSAWKVGDKWAMGAEADYGANITDKQDEINELLKAYVNMTIDDLAVDCEAGYYVLFEVTGETATTYTVVAKVAVRLATHGNLEVTGQLPVAGTYNLEDNAMSPLSTVPKETKKISMELTEKWGLVVSSTITVEKASMAIAGITSDAKTAFSVEFDATNVPDVNSTDSSEIISYKNYDIGMEMVAGMEMNMDFTPSLDLFQLPVVKGETWYTNQSMVTVSGSVNGHFDAHGLTDEQEEQIFTEELKDATGATDFPITFDTLNTTDGKIKNGQFGPFYSNITSMKMQCLYTTVTKTVGDEQREYLLIRVNDGSKIWYSPDSKFMSGVSTSTDDSDVDLPDEMSMLTSLTGSEVAMDPIDVETATKNIASIEAYTTKVASEVDGEGASASDLFFKPPFLGVFFAAIGVLSIGIIAFYVVKTRKH